MTTSEKCTRLHEIFTCLKRLRFETSQIAGLGFKNGIYIIFEEGEEAHGGDRIVRVGTVTGKKSALADRLKEHYDNEGRSVFRNNIALCLLRQNGDSLNLSELFLKDSIFREKWKKTATKEQLGKYKEINDAVSQYIRTSCSFVAFPIKNDALNNWEAKIISTVSTCKDCGSSHHWLGKLIPDKKHKIRDSGLWNITYVNDKNLITESELAELEQILESSKKSVYLTGGKQ